MMKKLLVAGLAAVAMATAPAAASAAPFTGTVGYAGIWTLPDTDGFDDESQVGIASALVLEATDILGTLISAGDLLAHATPIVYDPPTPPAGPMWTHASGVQFFLTSMNVTTVTDLAVVLTGTGYFTGAGFDETPGQWAFTAQRADGSVSRATYSADTVVEEVRVPEPATLALLGLGLIGAGVARRRSRD